jgi:hypothetical protein
MTSRQENIKSIFEELLNKPGLPGQRVHKRIDKSSPIKIHAACVFPQKGLMLDIGPIKNIWLPKDFHKPGIKGLTITLKPVEKTPGSDMVLLLELQQKEAIDVFTVFIARVCDELDAIDKPELALKTVIAIIDKWKHFFSGGSEVLTEERQTGLYGELYIMHYLVSSGVTASKVLEAWTGSKKTNQDYEFGAIAIEVKSTAAVDTSRINITNSRQLDDTGLDHLYISRILFDARQGVDRTLPILVDNVRHLINMFAPEASLSFEEKLLASGYQDKHEDFYNYRTYSEREMKFYEVMERFPRLIKQNIPDGVTKVSYEIDEEACHEYATDKDKVVDIVRNYCD